MTEVTNNNASLSSTDSLESKSKSFPKAFRKNGFPNDEVLIDRYSCALQRDILLLQGFFYVSENYICYYSNVVGFIHQVVIPFSKVQSILKKNAALVVPNAIQIDTKTGESYFFLSFINRDSVYSQITSLWETYKKNYKTNILIKKHINGNNDGNNKKIETKHYKIEATTSSNNNVLNEKNSNNSLLKHKDAQIKKYTKQSNEFNNENEEEKKSYSSYSSPSTATFKKKITNLPPNITPLPSPRLSSDKLRSSYKEKKSIATTQRRFINHYSSNLSSHLKRENGNMDPDNDDDNDVQNDVIFPKYIPQVSTMKEFLFIRVFLIITIIIVGFISILSATLRTKINGLSKEMKSFQNELPDMDTKTYDFSYLLPKDNNNKNTDTTVKNEETLERLKKLSELTGLTIPQLLNIDWNEYEVIN